MWKIPTRAIRALAVPAAVAALLVAGPVGADASSLAARPEICLNVQPPSAGGARQTLADLRELGVTCIRSSWWTWSTPESWAWCRSFREAGIEILPLVYDHNGDYRARFRALNAACGPFRYVQLGNEMDGGLQPGRAARAQGELWGSRLRQAAPVVRATGARVVSAGLAWNSPGVHDYLDGFLAAAGEAVDVVSIHTYGVHVHGEPASRWTSIRDRHGWRGPIWITEMGVSNTEARYAGRPADEWQRENVTRALRDPALRGLDRLYWFQYTQSPEGWGLLDMRGNRRPSFDAFRERPR